MKLRELWNHNDFLNGMILASIFGILLRCFQPYYDYDFAHYWSEPYGVLWYALNPFFQNWQTYGWQITAFQLPVVVLQFWLVRKKKLSKEIVALNLFQTALFRYWWANQDVTVVMFAPFAEINPLFSLLWIFQKVALGWSWNLTDEHWQNWWGQVHNNPVVFPYYMLVLWLFLPNIFWFVKWWKKKHKKWVGRSKHCGDCWSTGCTDDHCCCCDGGRRK